MHPIVKVLDSILCYGVRQVLSLVGSLAKDLVVLLTRVTGFAYQKENVCSYDVGTSFSYRVVIGLPQYR